MTMQIRVATLADAPALARVLIDTTRAAHRGQVPDEALLQPAVDEAYAESEQNWHRSLLEIAAGDNPQAQIFVAENEIGEVVGLTMGGPPKAELLPNSGEVYTLYVRPAHQGRGYGRALVQAVAGFLTQAGYSSLLIGSLAANKPACHFYAALGGRVVAERKSAAFAILLPELVYGWEDLQLLFKGERSDDEQLYPVSSDTK